MKDALVRQIQQGTEQAGKDYVFDETHDETTPAQWWFQNAPEGEVLFVVFYTQACRWSRCLGCNLPMKMSQQHVDFQAVMAQVDHIFSLPEVVAKRDVLKKVIVSNNGSVLDQDTFSSTALIYLLAKINLHLPRTEVVTLETRPEYVEVEELEFLARALAEGETQTRLELAVGFESFDDHIRNDVFDKGLKLSTFERFVTKLAPYGYDIKCYFMLKPVPEMSDEAAVADIKAAVDYLSRIAEEHKLSVNMHLNPTYAAIGTRLAEAFEDGSFVPPQLQDVVEVIDYAAGRGISLFVGLSDEGLAVPGGSFLRSGDEPLVAALDRFNVSQDLEDIKACRRV